MGSFPRSLWVTGDPRTCWGDRSSPRPPATAQCLGWVCWLSHVPSCPIYPGRAPEGAPSLHRSPRRGPPRAVVSPGSPGVLPAAPATHLIFSTMRHVSLGRKHTRRLAGRCCVDGPGEGGEEVVCRPPADLPSALLQVACEYGMVHVVSETGGPRGKDYCILYNPQWAHLPHDLSKAVSARGRPPAGSQGGLWPHPGGCWSPSPVGPCVASASWAGNESHLGVTGGGAGGGQHLPGGGRILCRGLATCHLLAASRWGICPLPLPCALRWGCACTCVGAHVWEPVLLRPACPPPRTAPE